MQLHFWEEVFFSDATQAEVCNKFCGNSILERKFFSDATQFVRTNWSTYLLLTLGRKNILITGESNLDERNGLGN
jgi:hypothetical protein